MVFSKQKYKQFKHGTNLPGSHLNAIDGKEVIFKHISGDKFGKDKLHNEYTLICDICGTEIEGFDNFSEAVGHKKQEGWKSKKHKGEWEDICPECR